MISYRFFLLTIGLLIYNQFSTFTQAQEAYEIDFATGSYDSLLTKTSGLENADAYFWHCLALDRIGMSDSALSLLKKGNTLYPDYKQIEEQLARRLFEAGNYVELKPLLQKRLDIEEFFLMYIRILEFENNNYVAVKLLRESEKLDALSTKLLVKLGDNLYQLDSLDAAAEIYKRILKVNPEDLVSRGKLANIYLVQKEYAQSISVCETALSLDSLNKKFIRIKALANFRKGDFKKAVPLFSYLLQNGDSSLHILKHLGISESKSYAFHDSREHLLQAFKKDTNDYEICFFLGRAYLNSTESEKGLYYLDRAEKLLEPDPQVLAALYLEKVSIYSTLKMYDEVMDLYLRAYRINPRPDYLFYLASLFEYRFEDLNKALEYYTRFLSELEPKELSANRTLREQQSISMKNIAEEKIESLREELFFNGDLNEDE